MSRHHIRAFALAVVALGAFPAAAQQLSDLPNLPTPTLVPALPAVEGGPMVVSPPAQPGTVPDLPPAHPCSQQDVEGLWKLLQVYEEPSGPESAVFYSTPSQYIKFKIDNTFEQYEKEQDAPIKLATLEEMMQEQTKVLQQYVVQAGGQLYFYRDSVAFKQQACFIVAESNSFFAEGQMLLMPPNTQSPTRWVKLYSKIWRASDAPKPTPAPQPEAAAPAQPTGPTVESLNYKPNKKKKKKQQPQPALINNYVQ